MATNRAFIYYLHPEILDVQGILRWLDIPELALSSGAKRVNWVNPADHDEAPLPNAEYGAFQEEIKRLEKVFNFNRKTNILRR